MSLRTFIGLALGVMLSAILVACGESDREEKAVSKAVEQSELLQYIPADTPYVFTNSRAMPDELMEKLLQGAAIEFENASQQIQLQLNEHPAEAPEDEKLEALIKAILDELEGKISVEGLASLGIPVGGKSALYGLGILPVARAEIEDQQKVEAFLERIEQRSGLTAEQNTDGATSYRRFDLDDLVGILAVTEKYLVAALVPTSSEAEVLPLVLGEQKPTSNLADAGTFKNMLLANDYVGYGDGYIDLVQFTEIALGESEGVNARIWQALSTEPVAFTPECSRFARSLAQSVPRWSFGFTEANAEAYKIKSLIETSPEIAGRLQKIAAPVPGLGLDSEAMFSFGMGLSTPEMREGIKAALLDIQQRGARCEWIDQQELTQMMQVIDMAFNPMMAGIKGFYLLVDDIQFNEQSMEPEAIDAQLLLAVDDPRGVFGMMGMLDHRFTQIQVPDDGTPVLLPMEGLAPTAPPAYVAIKDRALVLTTAADAVSSSAKMFAAALAAPAPVLAIRYNAAKLLSRTEGVAETVLQSMGDTEDAREAREAYESFRSSAQTYEQVSLLVNGSEKGLVMEQAVKLR